MPLFFLGRRHMARLLKARQTNSAPYPIRSQGNPAVLCHCKSSVDFVLTLMRLSEKSIICLGPCTGSLLKLSRQLEHRRFYSESVEIYEHFSPAARPQGVTVWVGEVMSIRRRLVKVRVELGGSPAGAPPCPGA